MAPNPSQLAPNDTSTPIEKTTFDGESVIHTEELRVARRAGTKWRAISRYVGLGIFLFGVALLIYVFLQALEGFKQLSDVGRLRGQMTLLQGDDWVQSIQGTAAVLGRELLRVLYLFILGYIGSAIAARGIGFFAASEAVIDEAVLPDA